MLARPRALTHCEAPYRAAGAGVFRPAAGAGLLFRGLRLFTSLRMLLWIPGVRTLLTRRLFPPAAAPAPAAGLKTPAPAAR